MYVNVNTVGPWTQSPANQRKRWLLAHVQPMQGYQHACMSTLINGLVSWQRCRLQAYTAIAYKAAVAAAGSAFELLCDKVLALQLSNCKAYTGDPFIFG